MGDFRRNSGRRCAEKVLFVPMMTFMPCCLLVGGECRCKSSMDSGIRPDRAEDSEEGKIAAAWSHFPAQQCYHQEEFYCSGFLLRTAERNNAVMSLSKAMHFASDTACRGREIRESPKCLSHSTPRLTRIKSIAQSREYFLMLAPWRSCQVCSLSFPVAAHPGVATLFGD